MISDALVFWVARQFDADSHVITPLGNGLINATYQVQRKSGAAFVLQRVNRQVFAHPELINANLLRLGGHVKRQPPQRLCWPELLLAADGQTQVLDQNGDFWRAQNFIAHTESLEQLRSLADARQIGAALAQFHALFNGFPAATLHDTLPGFHITPGYLQQYHEVLDDQPATDADCAAFIAAHAGMADILEQAKAQGLLQPRVIHGDPKLNNFLFDRASQAVVSLIDLDTVKPGLLHYDLGDCLRSCCHQIETDHFDLDIAAAILDGYLGEAQGEFSATDRAFLFPCMALLPFELGLRFYTDHLRGDRYFKVSARGENLHRARAQFQLCASVLAQKSAILALLAKLPGAGKV